MASKVEALESGAVDFITKPFERNILHHRVGLHLKLAGYQHFLEETVKELENDILLSFAELMEGRDKNTGGHVQRTALYMDSLCRELMRQGYFLDELNDDVIPLLKRAALLHDIGKIGISDNILSKSGRFNNEEFAEMKTHTTIGSDILESMYNKTPTQYYLKYAKTIAEGHHEKYDGTGYPYGLSGDSIPLCSRIMAVADVYDALVANRGYRKAMSHDDACELILSGKGTQFDPRVVGAFEAVNEEMAKMKNSLFVETLNQNIKGRVLELYTEST
jgi:putative two-component system response regulator